MSDPLKVVRAEPTDLDGIARLIADACCDLDQAAWLVPDRRQRRTILGEVARIQVEHAMFFGAVHVLHDGSAVAVWFDRHRPPPSPPNYATRLAAAAGSNSHRFEKLDRLLDSHRPSDGHEHLAFVAVTPGLRGTGRGRAVVQHHLARLDAAEVPTYAEAATNASRDFYRHLGYSSIGLLSVPNGSKVCLMWRPAPNADSDPGP